MDAWLAGFTDGEGCFLIADNTGGGYVPRFKIALRADDVAILESLREEFGGFVNLVHGGANAVNPSAQWIVARKSALAGLVAYFDEFPLRAKKGSDYTIWRRAVLTYCAHGGKAPELAILKVALMANRKYAETTDNTEATIEPSPQLRLVEGGDAT